MGSPGRGRPLPCPGPGSLASQGPLQLRACGRSLDPGGPTHPSVFWSFLLKCWGGGGSREMKGSFQLVKMLLWGARPGDAGGFSGAGAPTGRSSEAW